jgi:hypothetical protein
MTKKITLEDEENRIAELIILAVHALGLSKDEIRKIIRAGDTLQEQIKPILQKLAMVDQHFGLAVKDFEFTVPADYVHDTWLDTFADETRKLVTTYYFNEDLNSKNFTKATTNKLEPGKTYRCRVFPIIQDVTSYDCLSFLEKQRATLVGWQGITLLKLEKMTEFPVSKRTVSFDKKESLWSSVNGSYKVPGVTFFYGSWGYILAPFEKGFGAGDCLLCVSEK